MLKITNLSLPFDQPDQTLASVILRELGIQSQQLLSWSIQRRSLDARQNHPLRKIFSVIIEVADETSLQGKIEQDRNLSHWEETSYRSPGEGKAALKERPVVVGTGPAGLFAGLILAEAGLNPLLLERGKPVQVRTEDVKAFWRHGELDPESNVQFGEGGAGTFSDGKLGTRIKDKLGRREKVLRELVNAGAPRDILIDNKPHVGTANLVNVVARLRDRIEELGGEYRFGSRVADLLKDEEKLHGVILDSGERILSSSVILAIGHSARDTFTMLADRGVAITPKPFSVGFRIEHHQDLIDRSQYGKAAGHPALDAADYQLSYHTSSGRTVYSFCMCPGGTVIGAASEPHALVTNGMSQYERSGKNANSAIVVEVFPRDFKMDPLGGFAFQRFWEQNAYQLGGGGYHAPVQLVQDYLSGQATGRLGSVKPSYLPGIRLADLRGALPEYLTGPIAEALRVFDRKISGFIGPDAVFTGIETRTSCPLRIVRGKDFQSVSLQGLYPAGEGSGYAGGIMSSAIDGIKAAEMIIQAASVSAGG